MCTRVWLLLVVCAGSRVPVLPVRTSGRRVQNSTRKPEVADDIMYSACVQIHVLLCLPGVQRKRCIVVLPWNHNPTGYPCYPWKTTRTRNPKKMLPDSALGSSHVRVSPWLHVYEVLAFTAVVWLLYFELF